MTFFYDLFKRLDAVENRAEPTQLTERDMGKHNNATTGFKAVADKAAKEYGSKAAGERVAGAQFQKMKKAGQLEEQGMEEGSGVMHFKAQQAKAHGQDSFKLGDEEFPVKEEGGMPMTAKQKSFAALAEPRDKVTFADKIAGAKKEVDEMLGDVAAEAMKAALGGHGEPVEENWDDMLNDVKRRAGMAKKGDIQHGVKHDIKHTSTGRMVTRRVDPEGMSVGADGDAASSSGPRGRGRPKGTGKSTGAKGPSGNSKLMNPEEIEEAIAALEECGYTVTPLEEKAVSKKQQKFMGMVHAAQKGEKPASKEVAKVAKTMKKKDAEDFAATKHEGLPEKKKSEGKKKSKDVEESGTTAGSVATSSEASDSKPAGNKKSSGSSVVGKGIYDSLNRELESMISESMNINVSMSTDPHGGPQKSVTVTATDDDAAELAMMLSRAGVNMGADTGAHACAACGQAPCGCAEVVDENAADWPTEPEYQDMKLSTDPISNDLNRNKSSGQTVDAPPNLQEPRQGVMKEDQDDECPVHGYYALPNQEDESGCTCGSDNQVKEVGLGRLSELAGLGQGVYKDDMNEQVMAEDLQADDGEHYDSFDDFVGRFDADSFDNVEEHSAGREIRGYINGKCVMSWEYDDESMTSGYGNYDMTMLEAEQIDEIGDTPAGQAALRSYADKARSQGRWAAGVARHPMGKLVEPNADAIANKRFAGAKKADAKAAAKGPTLPESMASMLGRLDELSEGTGYTINGKPVDMRSIVIAGGSFNDSSDTYAEYAEFTNGTPLNDAELDMLSDDSDLMSKLHLNENVSESGSGIQAKYLGGEQFQVLANGETYQLTATALEYMLQPWVKDATDAVDSKGMITPDKMHMYYFVLAAWKIVNVNTRKRPNRSTESAIVNYIDQNHEDDLKQVAQHQQDWGDDVREGATMPKTDPAINLDVLDPKAVVNRGLGRSTKEKIKTRLGQNVYGDLNVAAGEPRSRYYADKPHLPEQSMAESVESHAGRLFRELQQFKG